MQKYELKIREIIEVTKTGHVLNFVQNPADSIQLQVIGNVPAKLNECWTLVQGQSTGLGSTVIPSIFKSKLHFRFEPTGITDPIQRIEILVLEYVEICN